MELLVTAETFKLSTGKRTRKRYESYPNNEYILISKWFFKRYLHYNYDNVRTFLKILEFETPLPSPSIRLCIKWC